MSEKIEYRASLGTDIESLGHALEALTAYFGASWVAGEGALHDAYLDRAGPVPAFQIDEWPELVNFTVSGQLPIKRDPLPAFRKLFEDIAACGDKDVRAIARIGFEEKSSKQGKRSYDTFFTELNTDYGRLCYSANGSRIQDDPAYASQVFQLMADELGVPITVEKTDIGYTLKHREGGELKVTGGFAGNNPNGFWCDTPPAIDGLLSALAKCRDILASGKTIEIEWYLGPRKELGLSPGTEVCNKVVGLLTRLRPEAESFSLTVQYRLPDVSGLDKLRKLCGAGDEIFTSAMDFDQPDGGLGHVRILTTAEGYALLLDVAEPVDVAALEEETGVHFAAVN